MLKVLMSKDVPNFQLQDPLEHNRVHQEVGEIVPQRQKTPEHHENTIWLGSLRPCRLTRGKLPNRLHTFPMAPLLPTVPVELTPPASRPRELHGNWQAHL